MEEERLWFVGVDWASETHQVPLSDARARGNKVGERSFRHGGEGLTELASWILQLTKATPEIVHVAIEIPHGPVVESLMERGFTSTPSTPRNSIVSGIASPRQAPRAVRQGIDRPTAGLPVASVAS